MATFAPTFAAPAQNAGVNDGLAYGSALLLYVTAIMNMSILDYFVGGAYMSGKDKATNNEGDKISFAYILRSIPYLWGFAIWVGAVIYVAESRHETTIGSASGLAAARNNMALLLFSVFQFFAIFLGLAKFLNREYRGCDSDVAPSGYEHSNFLDHWLKWTVDGNTDNVKNKGWIDWIVLATVVAFCTSWGLWQLDAIFPFPYDPPVINHTIETYEIIGITGLFLNGFLMLAHYYMTNTSKEERRNLHRDNYTMIQRVRIFGSSTGNGQLILVAVPAIIVAGLLLAEAFLLAFWLSDYPRTFVSTVVLIIFPLFMSGWNGTLATWFELWVLAHCAYFQAYFFFPAIFRGGMPANSVNNDYMTVGPYRELHFLSDWNVGALSFDYTRAVPFYTMTTTGSLFCGSMEILAVVLQVIFMTDTVSGMVKGLVKGMSQSLSKVADATGVGDDDSGKR